MTSTRIPRGLWLILVLGLIAGTASTTVALVSAQDADERDDPAD